jgi:FkbM family methyltransferase
MVEVSLLGRARRRVDEAAYLYALSHGLHERVAVTGFLLKRARAQLAGRLGAHTAAGEDASIDLYGARHVVDLLGSEIYLLDEIYREGLYDRVPDFIPRHGSTVVDVGANVGTFAIRQARRGARVYAFEPNPDCYRRLSRSVVENAMTGAIGVFNYAVGARAGVGTLRVPNNQTALGSLAPVEPDSVSASAVVSITCLDQILPALGIEHVDLLKIDTEGAEVDVLEGAPRMLRCTERIIVEYHSADLRGRVGALFGEHGFQEVLHVDTPAPYLPDAGMIYARRPAAEAAG